MHGSLVFSAHFFIDKTNVMDEAQLAKIVRDIRSPPTSLSNDDLDKLVEEFIQSIPHPGGSDLLFYPSNWGVDEDATAEEIASVALSWAPSPMVMEVFFTRRHPSNRAVYIYGVRIPDAVSTQVVSSGKYEVGSICVVALSGACASGQRVVRHGFVDRVYSAGEILGLSRDPVGTEVAIE